MDHLLECAEAFEQLLDVQYHIVLGRKNRLTELTLRFDPTEFHHLVGLHKLRDLRLARGNPYILVKNLIIFYTNNF